MNWFKKNIAVLQEHYPALAKRVEKPGLAEQVVVQPSCDGLVAYSLRTDGREHPVTNCEDPVTQLNAELGRWHVKTNDFSRPILVVGLNPGAEVLHLFQQREKAVGSECEQPLWICIDSVLNLCGFLKAYDARNLIGSRRVRLFWHEEVGEQADWLRAHPEFPYIFSMISLAPEEVQLKAFSPFLQLAKERDQQMADFQEVNNTYYDGIDDETLAEILTGRGGRKPRLLVPSCPWSTVIQYSIRDTCRAFERAGWETEILDGPAIIPSHHVMASISRFKPDFFLYVDHLRTEAPGVLPDHLTVVTWVQDPMPAINSSESACRWNEQAALQRRDLITGYTEQLSGFGYLPGRLVPLNMVVDPEQFHPRNLTAGQQSQYNCDVCLASNAGLPTEQVVQETLVPAVHEYGIEATWLIQLHDRLWEHYRSGQTLISYFDLKQFLKKNPEFKAVVDRLEPEPCDALVELLFWRLNDPIYRHAVLEWLDEYAQENPDFRLNLYGRGWDQHPRFSQYARGVVEHGKALSAAFQSARFGLHLNAGEQEHQRPVEIAASGGRILMRLSSEKLQHLEDCCRSLNGGNPDELSLLLHAVESWQASGLEPPPGPNDQTHRVLEFFAEGRIHAFDSREALIARLEGEAPAAQRAPVLGGRMPAVLRDAVLELLDQQSADRSRFDFDPDHHSFAYCTAAAAMARKAGCREDFIRLLPRAPEAAAPVFVRMYAMECCFNGLPDQALKALDLCPEADRDEQLRLRLLLLAGEYRAVLDAVETDSVPLHRTALFESIAQFYLLGTPPQELPLWDASLDALPTIMFWRAMLCRECGDVEHALALLNDPGMNRRGKRGWVGHFGGVEQLLTCFAAGRELETGEVYKTESRTNVVDRLLQQLDGGAQPELFEELRPILQEGLRLHLVATYSYLALIASAAALAAGQAGTAEELLHHIFPAYPVSRGMGSPGGLHSGFTAVLLERIAAVVPEFKPFYNTQYTGAFDERIFD